MQKLREVREKHKIKSFEWNPVPMTMAEIIRGKRMIRKKKVRKRIVRPAKIKSVDQRVNKLEEKMSANYELIAIITIGVTIIGFMWNLHRDMSNLRSDLTRDISSLRSEVTRQIADLRERMARLEGLFEGFTGRKKSQK